MNAVSWEVIGGVIVIIGTNFMFARWNYHTLMDKIKSGDKNLHERINEMREDRQKDKEEHLAQSAEYFAQLHKLVESTNASYSAILEKLGEVAQDVAVTKNNIEIAKTLEKAFEKQTSVLEKAIEKNSK